MKTKYMSLIVIFFIIVIFMIFSNKKNNTGRRYSKKQVFLENCASCHGKKEEAVTYFQSLWSDEFYDLWLEGGGLKKKIEK